MRRLSLIIICIILLASAAACKNKEQQMFRKKKTVMYTTVSVTVVSDDQKKAEAAIDASFDEIKRLETLLNFWTKDSEIAHINNSAGVSPVRVSPDTLEIINEAMEVSKNTHGAFDATIGPVIRQWDFKEQKMPEPDKLKEAVSLVDYRAMKLDLKNSTAYLENPAMSFDTGGIAKGFAADKAVEVLKSKGIKSGLVAVAGDIRAFGTRPSGEPWRVGIQDPRPKDEDGSESLMAVIELRDQAVSTSGDYERFFIVNGTRYHHLLDPRTGYPAMGLISVTIVADKAVHTDGYCTGVFASGPDKGAEVIRKMQKTLGMGAVLVNSDGKADVIGIPSDRIQWKHNRFLDN